MARMIIPNLPVRDLPPGEVWAVGGTNVGDMCRTAAQSGQVQYMSPTLLAAGIRLNPVDLQIRNRSALARLLA